ncbi:MAG: hypothetical protein JXA50_02665 [Deltaproteobacteria bacterium]|nr:hypothetical protein [Deltaproteobacteria bacterium]
MRYSALAFITAAIMTAAAPAYAHDGSSSEAVSIDIVSERGGLFLSIPHRDSWQGETHIIKNYLEARRGANYGICIRNRTPDRIGVVIAVDGRNIISGKQSDLKNTEAMYIINSYGQGSYEGWRTTSDKVHKFYFTDVADSYSVRTFGDDSAMGVIAVAVYREKSWPKPLYERKRPQDSPAAPSAEQRPRGKMEALDDERAGTGFGDEEYSPTVRVAFEPEKKPVQKTLIKYEWREVLCRKGILHCGQEAHNRLWDEDVYAPFPPGYPRY